MLRVLPERLATGCLLRLVTQFLICCVQYLASIRSEGKLPNPIFSLHPLVPNILDLCLHNSQSLITVAHHQAAEAVRVWSKALQQARAECGVVAADALEAALKTMKGEVASIKVGA